MINKMRLTLVVVVLAAVFSPLFGAGRGEVSGGGASEVKLENGDESCPEGMRFFDHELLAGEAGCIPEEPRAVAALAAPAFDLLLALGKSPAGAVGYLESIYARNFPYMEKRLDTTYVGFPVNLEMVAGLAPDLIIVSSYDEEIYDELRAIGPTVMSRALPNSQWKRSMRFMGDLLNVTEETEELLAGYEGRVRALGDVITDAMGDPAGVEVSVVRYYESEAQVGLQMQLADAFSSGILADAGLGRPESQDYGAEEAVEVYGSGVAATLSLEQVRLLDGEYLFAWSQGPNAEVDAANEGVWESLRVSPLWETLDAVSSGRVFQTGGHWVGWGLPAAHAVLDDLFRYVGGVEPEGSAVNPFTGGAG